MWGSAHLHCTLWAHPTAPGNNAAMQASVVDRIVEHAPKWGLLPLRPSLLIEPLLRRRSAMLSRLWRTCCGRPCPTGTSWESSSSASVASSPSERDITDASRCRVVLVALLYRPRAVLRPLQCKALTSSYHTVRLRDD